MFDQTMSVNILEEMKYFFFSIKQTTTHQQWRIADHPQISRLIMPTKEKKLDLCDVFEWNFFFIQPSSILELCPLTGKKNVKPMKVSRER
jgi:hypothetical protein